MKRFIMAVTLLVSSFYTTVQANDRDKSMRILKLSEVKKHVKESFKRQFPTAQFESWQQISDADLYLVRFLYNNEGVIAYVDVEGDVVATVRAVNRENLPITISQAIEEKYSSYQKAETLEMVLNGELNYLVTLVNEKAKITLKVQANGDTSEIKKEKIKATTK